MIDNSKNYLRALVSLGVNSPKAFAFEAITVTGTLAVLSIPEGTKYAQMRLDSTATGVAARYLQNKSVAVTSTVGMSLLPNGTLEVFDFANLNGFQIIKDQAGTTTLLVEYFR